MRMQRMTALPLALFMVSATGGAALYAQEHEQVSSPSAVHEQSARHMQDVVRTLGRLGVVQTAFDYIIPALSGPVVVLEGFTINGALKDDAEAQVKKLKWVTHVLNEVKLLDTGLELRRARQQIRATLQKQVPQAFPENHANIRIEVTLKGDVTLYGVVSKDDHKRLAAAIEQIKFVTFVGSVTNHIVASAG